VALNIISRIPWTTGDKTQHENTEFSINSDMLIALNFLLFNYHCLFSERNLVYYQRALGKATRK